MRFFFVSAVLLLAGCNLWEQTLVAPCVGKPVTGALGECPPCNVDSDCKILSNPCDQSSYCVHKDSSWKVNDKVTCAENDKFTPSRYSCRCLANGCDWHFTAPS